MFEDKYQGTLTTVYYSVGSHPLVNWKVQSKDGDLRAVQDEQLKSNVLQMLSPNVVACSIMTPIDPNDSLGIRLPFIVLSMKNLNKYLTFEITVLDSENFRRRFRFSNYHSSSKVSTYMCTMPLYLEDGWNQVRLNLADFTERTFYTTYMETVRIQVHANCRLRRVFFSDQLYAEDRLPYEYKLFGTKPIREKPKSMLVKNNKNKNPTEPV